MPVQLTPAGQSETKSAAAEEERWTEKWRQTGHYLHDRLSEILGAPVTQARLEGGTDVVPVTTRLIPILTCLETKIFK